MRANKSYMKVLVTMLTMIMVFPFASFGANASNPEEITISGIIKKQGITTYMYGTHVLLDDNGKTSYALKSACIDLDKYIDHKVTVKGTLVKGYPVDSGPEYLDVKSVNSP